MAKHRYHLDIVIFRGTPLDFQKYRHTSLYLKDEVGSACLYHAKGTNGALTFEARKEYALTQSRHLAKRISVGCLAFRLDESELGDIMSGVPIDNSNREYNCQHWVADALKQLTDKKLITPEVAERGLDAMIDATFEAEDKP